MAADRTPIAQRSQKLVGIPCGNQMLMKTGSDHFSVKAYSSIEITIPRGRHTVLYTGQTVRQRQRSAEVRLP